MRIKICGITQVEQGQALADLGATALGFICVPSSPRYVPPEKISKIIAKLPQKTEKIGVFAHSQPDKIKQIVQNTGLTGVQLHGEESPEVCQEIKQTLPNIELIKAFRLKNIESLAQITLYHSYVDTLLLDAYHPLQLGGTGQRIEQDILSRLTFSLPWFLAGGLTPDNVIDALKAVQPDGIDLSSGVEHSPGNKDLNKAKQLFKNLKL